MKKSIVYKKKYLMFLKSQISNLKSATQKSIAPFFVCLALFLFVVPLFTLAESPFGEPPQNPMDPGSAINPDDPTDPGPSATLDNPTNPGAVFEPGTGTSVGTPLEAGTGISSGSGNTAVSNGLLPTPENAGRGIGTGSPTDPGFVLYGGNGNRQNFWDYLRNLLSLRGQDNQLVDRNQDTQIVPYTVGTTPKTISSSSSSSAFSCTRNTSNQTLGGYINIATCVVLALIPISIAGLVLWFMFGAVKVLNDNEHETRNQYKQFLLWGVFIIFIALSFVGILRLMSKTLGL